MIKGSEHRILLKLKWFNSFKNISSSYHSDCCKPAKFAFASAMANGAGFVAREVCPSNRGFADRLQFSGSKDRQHTFAKASVYEAGAEISSKK